MSARLRYVLLIAARGRAPLAPLAASIFSVLGVFAYRENEVGQTWALTALLSCALAVWLVGAVLASEPAAQADMATVAIGGRGSRAAMELIPIGVAAGGLTVGFLALPLLTSPLVDPPMFKPPARPGDVAAAAVAHVCCAILGGAIAVLFSPPRLTRRPTAVAAAMSALLALVAISAPLGVVGGPVAVAHALTDAPPGNVDGPELAACLSCLALSALLLAGAYVWARRSG